MDWHAAFTLRTNLSVPPSGKYVTVKLGTRDEVVYFRCFTIKTLRRPLLQDGLYLFSYYTNNVFEKYWLYMNINTPKHFQQ